MYHQSPYIALFIGIVHICSAQQLDVAGNLIVSQPGEVINAPTANIGAVSTEHLVVKDRAIINTPLSVGKLTTLNGADIYVSGNVYAEGGMDFGQSDVLKVKKFSITTSTSPDAITSIAHGLDPADFIRVTGIVNHTASAGICPGYLRINGFEFYIRWTPTHLEVLTTDNSSSILNKECEVTIFYKP